MPRSPAASASCSSAAASTRCWVRAAVLDLFAGYYPDPVPTTDLLDLVGLRSVAATPWRHLSGGEQQRLSLALALIGRPEVAFLDEPTAGVDPEGRLAIRAVVADLRAKGVCIVLTTHELGEAERMADRIVILSRGRVRLEGTPHELSTAGRDPGHGMLSFGAAPGLDVVALGAAVGPGTLVTETAPGRYRVRTAGVPAPAPTASVAAHLAEHGVALTDLVTGQTLEDVYFEAVGREAASAAGEPDGPIRAGAGPDGGRSRDERPHSCAACRRRPGQRAPPADGANRRRGLHDPAPRRDPIAHARHPGGVPALLLQGLGGVDADAITRRTSSCPASSPSR